MRIYCIMTFVVTFVVILTTATMAVSGDRWTCSPSGAGMKSRCYQ